MGELVRTFRAGACMATVFDNPVTIEGRLVQLPTVSLQRRYKDRDGTWKTATSLRLHDLPKALVVLGQAYTWLVTRPVEDAAG